MESKNVVATVENYGGTKRKTSPWRRPEKVEFIPGPVEQREEYRATVIDTTVSIRRNIERSIGNFWYY